MPHYFVHVLFCVLTTVCFKIKILFPVSLGSYASWVSSVSEVRELGPACVRAAGAALQRCPPAAALALRKLAADCSGPAAALAPDIVQAAQVLLRELSLF